MPLPAIHDAKGHARRSGSLPARTLQACLRAATDRSADAAARAALENPGLAWDDLIALVRFHGVLGLVGAGLDSLGWDVVPPAARRVLARRLRMGTLRSFVFARELVEAIELLASHGVRALAWKGPGLAAALYGSFDSRSSADLDLLVDDADALRAAGLLAGPNLHDQDAGAFRTKGRHLTIIRPGVGICFELQSDLAVRWGLAARANAPPLDFAALWNRRETVMLCGNRVSCPGPQDLAVLLSVHGARHQWNRWVWLCDIDRLLRTGRLGDGGGAESIAARAGAQRRLRLAVRLARDLLGSPVPGTLRDQLDHPAITPLSAYAVHQILNGQASAPCPVSPHEEAEADLRGLAFTMGVMDRPSARLAIAYSFLSDRCRPESPGATRSRSLPPRFQRILHLWRCYGFSAAGSFLRSVLASLTGIPTFLAQNLGIRRS